MSSTSKILPLFVAGKEESIIDAVKEGGALADLTGVSYGYAKDTGKFCYISTDHIIHWVIGDNKKYVEYLTALPSVGDPEVLYIMNKTVYLWDEENQMYQPTYHDVSDQLAALTATVQTISETVAGLAEEMALRPTRDEVSTAISNGVAEANTYTDSAVSTVSDRLDATQTQLNTVANNLADTQSDVNVIQGNISGLQNDVTTLQGNVSDLRNDVNELQGNVSTLQSDVVSISATATSANEKADNLQTEVGTIQGNVTNLQTSVDDLEDKVGNLVDEHGNPVDVPTYVEEAQQQVIDYVNNTFELKEV